MADLFDVELIPRILSVDRKVRLSGIQKHRERRGDREREDRSKRFVSPEADEDDLKKQGTIDITV